jgi:predicted phage terminase large subunit-like protein
LNSAQLVQKINTLPEEERAGLLKLMGELEEAQSIENARMGFLPFVERIWPSFIGGKHHQIMAEKFDRIVNGDLKRLIICMPPRHTKSEFGSIHLPAYYLGHHPDQKIIQCSHTGELAVGFGRKVRDLVAEEDYTEIFPKTKLKADSKASGRWATSEKGDYFAIGVGGAVTGKGADLLIIDDPHSEQEGFLADPRVFDKVYEWYTSGPRQRLQPGAAIVVIMTRWGKLDLVGRILNDSAQRGSPDEWEVIEFPALLPEDKPLWPEFWPLNELLALRAELPNAKWQAQYQQNPTSDEGALVKREWWNIWESAKSPVCDFIIQTWDTAFTKAETADFSACQTWGVFMHPDGSGNDMPNLILLDAFKERMEFPDLKRKAIELWKEREPDAFIIEGKASGMPLIFELRAMGIPVQDFVPSRGSKLAPNDKFARLNAITDVFASGMVWRPNMPWAEEVVDEIAAFPKGDHDDYVDCAVMAVMRFRHGGFLSLHSDEDDEPEYYGAAEYY